MEYFKEKNKKEKEYERVKKQKEEEIVVEKRKDNLIVVEKWYFKIGNILKDLKLIIFQVFVIFIYLKFINVF